MKEISKRKHTTIYTNKLLQMLGSQHIPTLVGLGKHTQHAVMLRNIDHVYTYLHRLFQL